jgi:CHAD domain-containing protein
MRESVEREVKLVPPEGFQLPQLGRELPPRSFTSTYHDTPDLRLARHSVTLRHRLEDGAGLWQLKLPRGAARIELEEPGPPARPPKAFLDLLVAYLRGSELGRVARLRTRRQSRRVDGAEIDDDSVAVLEGQRVTARFRELEVELIDGDEDALHRLEKALRDAGAEPGEFTPKLYRVLELVYPPETIELPADASAGEVLRAALAEQYDRLLAHDPGTRLGTDSEDLHQMRVATRRSRAFLRAARPLLDPDWASELRGELGWLGSALGPARDLDVLLEHLRDDVAAVHGEAALGGFLEALGSEHEEARAAAVSALSDDRYFALLDRLDGIEPRLMGDADRTLGDLWRAELRRTRRTFKALGPKSPDAELHLARIKAKRARYAAELAARDLGRPGERFVSAAKRLQDVLGEHQDAAVAEERITAWTTADPDRVAVAEPLLERERERRRIARSEWPEAWAELDRRARKADA